MPADEIPPNLSRIVRDIESRLYEIERRVGIRGARNINDLEDVSVDFLTRADGDSLVWDEARQAWVATAASGGGSGFPVGPYDDGDTTYLITTGEILGSPVAGTLTSSAVADDTTGISALSLLAETSGAALLGLFTASGTNSVAGGLEIAMDASSGTAQALMNVTDFTDSASITLTADAGGDGVVIESTKNIRLNGPRFFVMNAISAPADGTLGPSEFALWLDGTPGLTILNIKAKDSGGTVRTAAIPLT